jgi:hypothetical protein
MTDEDQPPVPSPVEGPVPSPVEGTAPNTHTFSMNSREFYEAVTPPPDPWVWAGGLPREPRGRDREVIVALQAALGCWQKAKACVLWYPTRGSR